MRRLLLLIAVTISFGVPLNSRADQETTYRLSFLPLHQLPGERIAKFDLHIHSAMIVAFRRIPVGWQINIDNDPSWTTDVSGIAVVGASWLEPSELRPWFLSLLPEPGTGTGQQVGINIDGFITFANGDATRTIEIGRRNVSLTPSHSESGSLTSRK